MAGEGDRPPAARAAPQSCPRASPDPPTPALDRRPARAGSPPTSAGGDRRSADRTGGASGPAVARGAARMPHGRPADALRRLFAGHALAHDAGADLADRATAGHRRRPAEDIDAGD